MYIDGWIGIYVSLFAENEAAWLAAQRNRPLQVDTV